MWSKKAVPLAEPIFAGSEAICGFLNGGRGGRREQALPFNRQDYSDKGTRSIRYISEDFPDRVVCITGAGIVRGNRAWGRDGEIKSEHFIISPPDPKVEVASVMSVGTQEVDNKGRIGSSKNRSPFGAYDLASLRLKVGNTMRYGSQYGGMEILAAGVYKGTDLG